MANPKPDLSIEPKILKYAMSEFLEHGYEKTSIQVICSKVGVTTGAFYKRFPNKDVLFSTLVSSVTEHMFNIYSDGNEQGIKSLSEGQPQNIWEISKETVVGIVDYIYENKDIFTLLINCSAGSSCENFVDELVRIEEHQSIEYLNMMKKAGYECEDISDESIHMLISAQYYAIFEVIRHNIPKEQAVEIIAEINSFFMHSWRKIFGC